MALRACFILALAGLSSGLDIPFVGGSTELQLDQWVSRAEKLAGSVSQADLERLHGEASAYVSEARKAIHSAVHFVQLHHRYLEIAAGAVMLFWGKNVMHLLLFAQTFRLAGLGPFKTAWSELRSDFANRTAILKQEAPNVIVARDALLKLKSQQAAISDRVNRVRVAAASGTSVTWFGQVASNDDVKAEIASAREELDAVMEQAALLTSSMGSMSKLAAALDVSKLQALLLPLWQTVAAAIATATSPAMATLTTSLGIGSDLVAGVKGVVLPLVERARTVALTLKADVLSSPKLSAGRKKFLELVLSSTVRASAVYFGYLHSEMALLFSGCLVGARALIDGVNALGLVAPDALGDCGGYCVESRPWWRPFGKRRRKRLELEEGSSAYTLALTGLAGLGFIVQAAPWLLTTTIPGLAAVANEFQNNLLLRLVRGVIYIIERPFVWADDYLEGLAVAARARSAGVFKGILPRAAGGAR